MCFVYQEKIKIGIYKYKDKGGTKGEKAREKVKKKIKEREREKKEIQCV